MNPIVFALRNPVAVMVGVAALLVGSGLAVSKMRVDVFPALNQPVIYVCQPYGGMSPQQMEGLLTTYYDTHFIYVSGIHHVESKNIQGMTLMKLAFHPGTDMGEAMGETVAAVNRARFMMPPGTVPPFVTRLDTGSAGVGYLVLSSETKSIKDIQDLATLKVRPMISGVPGLSSPPAFGGNQRAIVVSVNPDELLKQGLTLDQVTEAVGSGNAVSPSGNVRIGDRMFLVNTNVMAGLDPVAEMGKIAVKTGPMPVLLRDVATITDGADITTGYVLVNGRRSVYMLITKRSEASTLAVVEALKATIPKIRDSLPEDVGVEFAFDQSPIVKEAVWGVITEGLVGALLTGLMVLVFLRDWRSVIVVVLNIPLALAAAVFALWVAGQTINLMTLGGLALAVGILVDEATVEVENIHTQMERSPVVARAVRRGNQETAVPRLLAMLCILAVFIPSFFMTGAARELFVPLSLAVGFSMIASYLLSSTFVPVLCTWLLRPLPHHETGPTGWLGRVSVAYEGLVSRVVGVRRLATFVYLAVAAVSIAGLYQVLGTAIFPPTDQGQFLLRMRAPTGTRIERTEELAREATRLIRAELGPDTVGTTIGYVGMFPTNYPIQAVYQWTAGPEEVMLRVALVPGLGGHIEDQKARLRHRLDTGLKDWLAARWREDGLAETDIAARLPGLRLSFEPGDIVSEVMSFGAATPVEVQISGSNTATCLGVASKLRDRLVAIPELKDLQISPAQDYPTVDVKIDRVRAGTLGLTTRGIGAAVLPAVASSRYMNPMYWLDPVNGQAYIVQVQVPPPKVTSAADIGTIPVRSSAPKDHGMAISTSPAMSTPDETIQLHNVASIRETTTPAEVDRYNMRRTVRVTANVASEDLGSVKRKVEQAIAAGGDPPRGVMIDVRGQLETLGTVQSSLARGLAAAVLAIFLLLTAYFQSPRLALVSVAAVPATLAGVAAMLTITGTTLNLQSFMGAIMSLGVSVANAILLVTSAERARLGHGMAVRAAVEGGRSRLRPVLMTSCAMIAGMVPMAIGFGSGGDQTAPLGRAVVGGLIASTLATLVILPAVFATVQKNASTVSASLDPDDPGSACYDGAKDGSVRMDAERGDEADSDRAGWDG